MYLKDRVCNGINISVFNLLSAQVVTHRCFEPRRDRLSRQFDDLLSCFSLLAPTQI